MQASDMNLCRLPQTNKVLPALTLFTLTAFLWLAASASIQAQDAKAIMQKLVTTYQGLNTYEGSANADAQMLTPDDKVLLNASTSVTMAYERPNKIKLEFSTPAGGQSVYSDGTTITAYSNSRNTYYHVDSAPTPQKLVAQLQKVDVALSLDTLYFLCLGHLPSNITNLALKGNQRVNGRAVYVITGVMHADARQATSPQGKKVIIPAQNSYWTWWVDKQTSLLARMEVRVPNIPKSIVVIENKKRIQKTFMTTSVLRQTIINPKPNPKLDDQLFAFTPPPGATETKSAQQLLNGK